MERIKETIMSDNSLTTEQLTEVRICFIDAFNALYSKYTDTETLPAITRFLGQMSLQVKPWVLLTNDGLQLLVRTVFENDIIRDFIFSLQFQFFSSWGHDASKYEGLVEIISDSVGIKREDLRSSLIPEQLTARLPVKDDCIDILIANKWLVIIALTQLYVTVTDHKVSKK